MPQPYTSTIIRRLTTRIQTKLTNERRTKGHKERWTLKHLSRESGVSYDTLCNYFVDNKSVPRWETVDALLCAMDWSVCDLLSDEEKVGMFESMGPHQRQHIRDILDRKRIATRGEGAGKLTPLPADEPQITLDTTKPQG